MWYATKICHEIEPGLEIHASRPIYHAQSKATNISCSTYYQHPNLHCLLTINEKEICKKKSAVSNSMACVPMEFLQISFYKLTSHNAFFGVPFNLFEFMFSAAVSLYPRAKPCVDKELASWKWLLLKTGERVHFYAVTARLGKLDQAMRNLLYIICIQRANHIWNIIKRLEIGHYPTIPRQRIMHTKDL